MQIQIQSLSKPQKGSKKAAAVDLKASIKKSIKLRPYKTVVINSGLKIYIKKSKCAALVMPRSGLGSKGIRLANCVGLIDPDYQGEIKIPLYNDSNKTFKITKNMRVAQLLFVPIVKPRFKLVKKFKNKTQRNKKGFGSTGVR